MPASDHIGVAKASPSGMVHRDLGKNEAGFHVFVVSWRGSFYRISVKKERAGPVWNGSLRAPSVSVVVLAADKDGAPLEDSRVADELLLEDLQAQGRIFATWVPA